MKCLIGSISILKISNSITPTRTLLGRFYFVNGVIGTIGTYFT